MDPDPPVTGFAHGPPPAGARLVAALERAVSTAVESVDEAFAAGGPGRREPVRLARRALKEVRAVAPLCRAPRRGELVDALVEFAGRANQLLGPVRDQDALLRSVHRLSDRFADPVVRRTVRTVLLATLVFAHAAPREDAQFADGAIVRARRALRPAGELARLLAGDGDFDAEAAVATLGRAFAQCLDELEGAMADGDLARLHDCRKRASFLALGLRPLGDAAPAVLRRLRARAKRLASTLGEERDLSLLDAEMRGARAQLAGSPLLVAIEDALRLARLEAGARSEDAARALLRLRRKGVLAALDEAFGID
ncbi:MAG: hypothetical protein RIS86_2143 [Planctomycetota bacterium]